MAEINIASEIARYLQQYTSEVEEEVKQASNDVTKDGVSQLKAKSPRRTGKYAKGWTRKKQGNGYVVHNRVHQLTHLLEKGHQNRDGSRTPGREHIAPVEEQMIREFTERVERAIKS